MNVLTMFDGTFCTTRHSWPQCNMTCRRIRYLCQCQFLHGQVYPTPDIFIALQSTSRISEAHMSLCTHKMKDHPLAKRFYLSHNDSSGNNIGCGGRLVMFNDKFICSRFQKTILALRSPRFPCSTNSYCSSGNSSVFGAQQIDSPQEQIRVRS
jgi:hypothetical protein